MARVTITVEDHELASGAQSIMLRLETERDAPERDDAPLTNARLFANSWFILMNRAIGGTMVVLDDLVNLPETGRPDDA